MARALFVVALAAAGCFPALPHEVKTQDFAAALNAGRLRPKKLVVASSDGKVRIGVRTPLRFCRPDGTRTPWVNAGELRINDAAIFVWRRLPLRTILRVKMAGLDEVSASLVSQVAPSDVQLVWLGKDSLEAVGPSAWVENLVLAVARVKAASQRGLSERWFNDRALKYLKDDLRAAPLGRWSFLTPRGWTDAVEGGILLATVKDGVPFADGLLWSDVRGVEIFNEQEHDANIALAVLGNIALAAVAVAAGLVAAPAGMVLGRVELSPRALEVAARAGPPLSREERVEASSGDLLWSSPCGLPDPAGDRALFAEKRP